MNKYEKWYLEITKRAKTRQLNEYTERHHILPESLGGDDSADNLVNLTPREHFICHWLLIKMTEGESHWKMLNALRMMRAENPKQKRYGTKITARVYANLKEEYAVLRGERFSGENNPFYGKTHTDEVRNSIKTKNTGRKHTEEEIEKQKRSLAIRKEQGTKRKGFSDEYKKQRSEMYSGEGNPNYGKKHTDETKEKLREKATGRKQSEETVRKKAEASRGTKREKKHCDWCGVDCAVNTYPRFHGDNCHMNPSSPRYNPAKKTKA